MVSAPHNRIGGFTIICISYTAYAHGSGRESLPPDVEVGVRARMFLIRSCRRSHHMKQVPAASSLPAPMTPALADRNALAGRLRLSRAAMKRDGRCAEKHTPSSAPAAGIGDGRDDPARQQAAAHRLVLGRLPDGDPLQRHLCPAAPETARYRLLPQRLAARPQAARQHGRPRAQPVVGPGGNRRGQPSIPDQRRSSHRRARTQPRRQDAHRRRHRTRGRKHPRPPAAGRNLLLRRRRPRTLRRNRRRSRRQKPTAGPATLRSPPIATMSMSSGRPPLTSSCRGYVHGREASTTGCERKHLQAYLDEFVFRFNRRKTRHAAFRRTAASPPMQNPLPTAC